MECVVFRNRVIYDGWEGISFDQTREPCEAVGVFASTQTQQPTSSVDIIIKKHTVACA